MGLIFKEHHVDSFKKRIWNQMTGFLKSWLSHASDMACPSPFTYPIIHFLTSNGDRRVIEKRMKWGEAKDSVPCRGYTNASCSSWCYNSDCFLSMNSSTIAKPCSEPHKTWCRNNRAEGAKVVTSSSLEGKVQIPQTDIFMFFCLSHLPFQRRPTSFLVS